MNPRSSRNQRILLAAALAALLGVLGYRGWEAVNPPPAAKPQPDTAAEAGDAAAQRALGRMLFSGEGGRQKDLPRAIALFRAAAAQNHRGAQKDLGWAYENGLGVPRDAKIAAGWYEKAAAQGEPWAQNNLGLMYLAGEGVEKNVGRGVELIEKSAAQNVREAQFGLGRMYYYGDQVPADPARGMQWLERGAANGSGDAQGLAGRAYQTGVGAPRDFAKAAAYYEKAVAQNDDYAGAMYGRMLFYGEGVAADAGRGAQLLRRAADSGNALAQFYLGAAYLSGAAGFAADPAQGLKLLTAETVLNSDLGPWSRFVMADYHGDPANPARDQAKAIALYQEAAAARQHGAEVALGKLYLAGQGVPKDEKKAIDLFVDAASQGDANACYQMGLAFQKGTGGAPKDRIRAYVMFSYAVRNAEGNTAFAQAADEARGRLSARELVVAKRLMEPEAAGTPAKR